MKKLLCFVVTLILIVSLGIVSFAAKTNIGSDIGDVYESNTITKINSFSIPNLKIKDKVTIVANDLNYYGFDVTWDGEKREIHIYRDTEKSWTPYKEMYKYINTKYKVADISQTNIKTFLEDKEIQSFNVNGKIMITFDSLENFGIINSNDYSMELILNDQSEINVDRLLKPIEINPVFPYYINRKSGYIDRNGKKVITKRAGYEFSEGLAVEYDQNTKSYGYLGKTGDFVIKPQFEMATFFSEGLAAVEKNGKWSYIDYAGNYVIKDLSVDPDAPKLAGENRQIDYCGPFKDGYAQIIIDAKYEPAGISGNIPSYDSGSYLIDKSGKIFKTEVDCKSISYFSEGLAHVSIINKDIDEKNTYMFSQNIYIGGFVDKNGKLVLEQSAQSFSEGLAGFYSEENKKYGYIDKSGNVVIEAKFDQVAPFKEGLAMIVIDDYHVEESSGKSINGYIGYIDKKGEVVIPPIFDYVRRGVSTNRVHGDGLYINNRDEEYYFSEGLAAFEKSGKWGFINKNGQIVIEPQYEGANSFHNGLAKVKKGYSNKSFYSEWRYIDRNGKLIHYCDQISY